MTEDNIERLKTIIETLSPSALLEAPEFSTHLFEFSPDAIVIIDHNGVIRLMNKQAELLFGYHRNELAGKEIEMLLPEKYRGEHGKHVKQYLRQPRLRPMGLFDPHFKPIGQLEGQSKWGEIFLVDINLSPIQTLQGLFVIATVRRRDGGSG